MKNSKLYQKALALRNAADDLLAELEKEQPSAPRQRQNKKNERVLDFASMYGKKKYK